MEIHRETLGETENQRERDTKIENEEIQVESWGEKKKGEKKLPLTKKE